MVTFAKHNTAARCNQQFWFLEDFNKQNIVTQAMTMSKSKFTYKKVGFVKFVGETVFMNLHSFDFKCDLCLFVCTTCVHVIRNLNVISSP